MSIMFQVFRINSDLYILLVFGGAMVETYVVIADFFKGNFLLGIV